MSFATNWSNLRVLKTPIVALEYYSADRPRILSSFHHFGSECCLPVYYWNPGYATLQQVQCVDKNLLKLGDNSGQKSISDAVAKMYNNSECVLCKTELSVESDVLQFLLENDNPGIFLLEDILESGSSEQPLLHRYSQLANAFFELKGRSIEQYWVLLGEYIQLPSKLRPLIPLLKCPLPDGIEVEVIVDNFCDRNCSLDFGLDAVAAKKRLAVSSLGLPSSEVELVLDRSLSVTASVVQIAQLVLEHKISQLRDQGLEFIAAPDVPHAGGLDLLDAYLSEVVKLSEADAKKYHLRPPKGMLLWGPPGTGKSLSAKLAAKKLGYALISASWGNILGSSNPDRALKKMLDTADNLGGCVLFFDDFDKGFSGWESNADGGIARRLSQKLLTWMQEHESPVLMLATVNRLEMLPAELIRRFDDGGIWFVDLPHNGARYEIFNLHLAKYFPEQFGDGIENPWNERQWYSLLSDYAGATSAEIAIAVKRCAERAYCEGRPGKIELADLRYQRTQFVLSSERSSEDIQGIRNKASFARPATGRDRSLFAAREQELFEYRPPACEKI
ncbi:MAG: ATP-binding protein [Microcoleus sp. SU_5_6]|nr:ATP-binding protein [Microcoleus sp. SU_5_6]NJL65657.1 ATP-binding protein [Microcoleus sp. SM1_3_4]